MKGEGALYEFGTPMPSCRCDLLGSKQQLFPSRNFYGGGSPEGAEIPALSLFSPLWVFFGYFLARQKVT